MKQIITDTFRAGHKLVAPSRDLNHHTFEIFGYDFMLDEDFKVYLIEVNTNPCLETSCPILQKIITDMVDSGFRIAIDPLYPPPNLKKRMNSQMSVIQWQLVFDEEFDAGYIAKMQEDAANQQDDDYRKVNSSLAVALDDGVMNDDDLIQECEDEGEFD